MGGGTIHSHFGSEAHPAYHISHLADDMVGKQSSDIIFEHRIHHTIYRHNGPQPDQ
ncbi:hypothetical protein ES703_51853 [subsurface metagenome]